MRHSRNGKRWTPHALPKIAATWCCTSTSEQSVGVGFPIGSGNAKTPRTRLKVLRWVWFRQCIQYLCFTSWNEMVKNSLKSFCSCWILWDTRFCSSSSCESPKLRGINVPPTGKRGGGGVLVGKPTNPTLHAVDFCSIKTAPSLLRKRVKAAHATHVKMEKKRSNRYAKHMSVALNWLPDRKMVSKSSGRMWNSRPGGVPSPALRVSACSEWSPLKVFPKFHPGS